MTDFALQHVKYIPKELQPRVLYVSKEYEVAAHLCACGCGSKVTTPLGPAEWTFSERRGLPTLDPSIGSWQLPCQSHYIIRDGRIVWAPAWSKAAIESGRAAEEHRRRIHYDTIQPKRGWLAQILDFIRKLFASS